MLEKLFKLRVFFALLVVGDCQKTKVVSHNKIPLFEFIEHLKLLYFEPFILVDAFIVTKLFIDFTHPSWYRLLSF